MIVNVKRPFRPLVALLLGAVVAGMAGCPNLSRDLDLKAQIETDVLEANAEQIAIRVQPESDAMGMTTPIGSTTAKVGVAFQISTTVTPDYAFVGWEMTAGDGEVTFADDTSQETMATVTRKGTGSIIITALFDPRPKVIIKDPDGGEGILTNRKILITFSEEMDQGSISLEDTIDVLSRSRNFPSNPLVSIESVLTLTPDPLNKALVTISLTGTNEFAAQHYIWVRVLKGVKDAAGNMMKEDFSWYFITGDGSDTISPSLRDFAIQDSDRNLIPDDGFTNCQTGLRLITDADDNDLLALINVTETGFAGKEYSYTPELQYNLQTTADGRVNISVMVKDRVGNESVSRSQWINVDTGRPGVSLTCSDADGVVRDGAVVNFTATFTEAVVATPTLTIDGTAHAMSGGGATWTYGWTVAAGAGVEKDVAVTVSGADAAGNTNTAATGDVNFHIDNVRPGVSLGASGHPDTLVRAGDTVNFTATFTEAVVATPTLTIDGAVYTMSGSGTSWTYSWTVDTVVGRDKNVTVVVSGADAAGNANTAATGDVSFHIDNVKPTVVSLTCTDADRKLKDGDVVDLTVTFSESVVATPTVTIAGGGSVVYTSGSGTTWTYTWTVNGGGAGVEKDVTAAVSATDVAGNSDSETVTSVPFHIDNVKPTVVSLTCTDADRKLKDGDVVDLTVTFTEPVIATPTVAIAGGGPVVYTSGSGTTWTYTWTVNGGGAGVEKDVTAAVSATDTVGNSKSETVTSVPFHIDNIKPVFSTITLSDAPKNKTATVVFSEAVYANTDATGALVGSNTNGSSDISVTENSAAADITAWEITPAHTAGSDTLTIDLTWSGTPTTGVDIVTVAAANATSIYDAAGNSMEASASGDGTCKSLALSIHAAANNAVETAMTSPRTIGSVSWSLPFLPAGSRPVQGSADVKQPAVRPVSLSGAHLGSSPQSLPLDYFRRPLPLRRESQAVAPQAVVTGSDSAGLFTLKAAANASAGTGEAVVRVSLGRAPTMEALAVQPAEKRGSPSPWLVIGLAMGAALLLAGGLFAARFLGRTASRR